MDSLAGPLGNFLLFLGKSTLSLKFLIYLSWPNKYFVMFSLNFVRIRLNLDVKKNKILFFTDQRSYICISVIFFV